MSKGKYIVLALIFWAASTLLQYFYKVPFPDFIILPITYTILTFSLGPIIRYLRKKRKGEDDD
ncbi:MAG: hypothetical protein Q4P30_03315 [Eubacteriales bacterium]|nr:hypothetical protein [Eubacteriales bacterium]